MKKRISVFIFFGIVVGIYILFTKNTEGFLEKDSKNIFSTIHSLQVTTQMCEYFEYRKFECPWNIHQWYIIDSLAKRNNDLFVRVHHNDNVHHKQWVAFTSIRLTPTLRTLLTYGYDDPPFGRYGTYFNRDTLYPYWIHNTHKVFIDDLGNQVYEYRKDTLL